MERLARGDRSALGPLVERHYTRVDRIALSYLKDPDDALDAVQEVFVKLCDKAASWQASTRLEPCPVAVFPTPMAPMNLVCRGADPRAMKAFIAAAISGADVKFVPMAKARRATAGPPSCSPSTRK